MQDLSTLRSDIATAHIVTHIVAYASNQAMDKLSAPTRRSRSAAFARQTAMYLTHTVFGFSFSRVATAFGRDRTTVSHACRVIEEQRDDPEFDALLERIEDALSELPSLSGALAGAQAGVPLARAANEGGAALW